jgi:hypothetical protein
MGALNYGDGTSRIPAAGLVAAVGPGIERQPLKKLEANEALLLKLLLVDAPKPTKLGTRSKTLWLGMKRGATGFGRRAGCERAMSRPM